MACLPAVGRGISAYRDTRMMCRKKEKNGRQPAFPLLAHRPTRHGSATVCGRRMGFLVDYAVSTDTRAVRSDNADGSSGPAHDVAGPIATASRRRGSSLQGKLTATRIDGPADFVAAWWWRQKAKDEADGEAASLQSAAPAIAAATEGRIEARWQASWKQAATGGQTNSPAPDNGGG